MTDQHPDPSNGWNDRMLAEEPEAREKWCPGMTFAPHDGVTTDVNLLYTDLFAGPNHNVPDVMADWTPSAESEAAEGRASGDRGRLH